MTDYVKLINCIFVIEALNKTSLEPLLLYFHKQADNHGLRARQTLIDSIQNKNINTFKYGLFSVG